jgi:hypothetical protein
MTTSFDIRISLSLEGYMGSPQLRVVEQVSSRVHWPLIDRFGFVLVELDPGDEDTYSFEALR